MTKLTPSYVVFDLRDGGFGPQGWAPTVWCALTLWGDWGGEFLASFSPDAPNRPVNITSPVSPLSDTNWKYSLQVLTFLDISDYRLSARIEEV